MKLSIIIPVFNDTDSLAELLDRIQTTAVKYSYVVEVILVDDGSAGDTWRDLKRLIRCRPQENVRLIRLADNYGQHAATLCGITHSEGDTIVTLDADLQHPPESIPTLIQYMDNNNLDLVYGTAFKGHPLSRRITSLLFRILAHPIGSPVINASAFRSFKKNLVSKLSYRSAEYFVFIDALLIEEASQIGCVEVPHCSRRYGSSGYTWTKLLSMAWKAINHSGITANAYILFGLAAITYTIILFVAEYYLGSPSTLSNSITSVAILNVMGIALILQGLRQKFWGSKPPKMPTYIITEETR